MNTTDTIDVSAQVEALCARLDLRRDLTVALSLTPSEATATVYRLNDQGHKYVDPDTGVVAVDACTFSIRTDQ